VAGILVLWFTKKQKTGKLFVSFGTLLLFLFSYMPFSDVVLLKPLEQQFPSLLPESNQESTRLGNRDSGRWIIVLAGGHEADPSIPPTSQPAESSLARLVEGIRLYKAFPGSGLFLSGGFGFDPVLTGEIMSSAAQALGVDRRDLTIGTAVWDTREEALSIKELSDGQPVILVTSAVHMPRAVALFNKLGMHPTPAPSHYLAKQKQGFSLRFIFPNPEQLVNSTRAIHEYFGLLWAHLTGQA
jgi:uncharacterized SAM-binding protein YcdF (DUF218 family)